MSDGDDHDSDDAAPLERKDTDEERKKQPYRVGPGKPPMEHRFQPGRSGNPYGRPRKRAPVLLPQQHVIDVARILMAPVTMQVDGQSVTMPSYAAALELQRRKGLSGHGPSLNRYLKTCQAVLRLIEQEQPEATREFDRYSAFLAVDDGPANWNTFTLNQIAFKLYKRYVDPFAEPPAKPKSRFDRLIDRETGKPLSDQQLQEQGRPRRKRHII